MSLTRKRNNVKCGRRRISSRYYAQKAPSHAICAPNNVRRHPKTLPCAAYHEWLSDKQCVCLEWGESHSRNNLQDVVGNGVNDGTNGGADGGETEASDKGNDGGRQLDEEVLAVSAGDLEESLEGLGDVLEEVTNGGGLSDDGANGGGNGGEAKTGDESGNLGGELDEELLGVGTGDGQGALDLGGNVLDDLTALEVLAEGGNNGTDGDTDGGETKTGDETSNGGGERDQESTDISTDNGDETVNDGAETSDETTETGGRGNNGTEGSAKASEAEAGDEGSDLGGELDEQSGGIGADNGQDVVKLGAKVLDDVTVLDGGHAGGSGSGAGGGGTSKGLGEIGDLGDNGELVKVKLLEEVANLESLSEALDGVGGGSESRASQSGEGSNERGLHLELGYIETVKSDWSLFKE